MTDATPTHDLAALHQIIDVAAPFSARHRSITDWQRKVYHVKD
ncbi:hypothetical protein [Roseinatronobacter sp. S2]|nr:hypothetical protein [Roseinatronobacter sp. S2]WFE77235.1 hypothetical protein P8S53_20490 [Roseinatronobacter sp. S2]